MTAKAFSTGFVRREALLFEWRLRDLHRRVVVAGGSLIREVPGRVGAAPTKPGWSALPDGVGPASVD